MSLLQLGRLAVVVMVSSQVGLGVVELMRGHYRSAAVAGLAGIINALIYWR
jgi:hypothetical protein